MADGSFIKFCSDLHMVDTKVVLYNAILLPTG